MQGIGLAAGKGYVQSAKIVVFKTVAGEGEEGKERVIAHTILEGYTEPGAANPDFTVA